MKIIGHLICIIVLFVLLTNTLSQELVASSFRSQATGYTLRDDFDLVYDPVELHFVSGTRIYTNLSNALSTDERVLDNISNNTLLFGIAGNVPAISNMRTAILYQLYNSSSPNSVEIDSDLDGVTDLYGEGDLVDKFSGYFDTNSDGLFDRRTQINQEVHDNTLHTGYGIGLTVSFPVKDWVFGGQVNIENYENKYSTLSNYSIGGRLIPFSGVSMYSPTFSRELIYEDINNSFISEKWLENGKFKTVTESNSTDIIASGMKPVTLPFGESEFRVNLNYGKATDNSLCDDRYSAGLNYFTLNNTDREEYQTESEYYLDNLKIEETHYGAGFGLKRVFLPGKERRFDGFWHAGFMYKRSSGDYKDSYENRYMTRDYILDELDSLNTDRQIDLEDSYKTDNNGDYSTNLLQFYALTNIPLGDRVVFGLGAALFLSSTTRETNYELNTINYYGNEVIDQVEDYSDLTTFKSRSVVSAQTWEYGETNFYVPVGIEYAFTDSMRWKIRFGALFNYNKAVYNLADQITKAGPEITREERGDGSIDIDVSDNEYSSTSEHSEYVVTETIFTYGLGYQPTEHLQIDLLGFLGTQDNSLLDANFYRQLRLSFTIRM